MGHPLLRTFVRQSVSEPIEGGIIGMPLVQIDLVSRTR